MRILFISHHYPVDLAKSRQGTFKRMGLFLDALKAIADLDILFFTPPEEDTSPAQVANLQQTLAQAWQIPSLRLFLHPTHGPSRGKLAQQLNGIVNFYQQTDFYTNPDKEQAIATCLEKGQPDLIFAHRLNSLAPLMRLSVKLPPILFDLDDIEHIKFMRQIRQPPTRPQTLLYYLQVPARLRGELRGVRQAARTFICSELDRRYLGDRWRLPGVVTIPNAVAIPEPAPLSTEPTLMLIGGYYYFPNLNAANFLIEKVWPLVYKARPDARLIIAGTHPENIRAYGKDVPGLEFTGFVDDLDALYARSRVVCCPILSGGGTRVKMIEAAAYGKPIVSTRIGAEGLEMVSGRDYLQRDRPQDFAAACLKLLADDGLCQALGQSARAAAIQHYDHNSVVQKIEFQINGLVSKTKPDSLAVYQPG
jgi:glycosyltransferase involved in cell wall biosynthesis